MNRLAAACLALLLLPGLAAAADVPVRVRIIQGSRQGPAKVDPRLTDLQKQLGKLAYQRWEQVEEQQLTMAEKKTHFVKLPGRQPGRPHRPGSERRHRDLRGGPGAAQHPVAGHHRQGEADPPPGDRREGRRRLLRDRARLALSRSHAPPRDLPGLRIEELGRGRCRGHWQELLRDATPLRRFRCRACGREGWTLRPLPRSQHPAERLRVQPAAAPRHGRRPEPRDGQARRAGLVRLLLSVALAVLLGAVAANRLVSCQSQGSPAAAE